MGKATQCPYSVVEPHTPGMAHFLQNQARRARYCAGGGNSFIFNVVCSLTETCITANFPVDIVPECWGNAKILRFTGVLLCGFICGGTPEKAALLCVVSPTSLF